MLAALIAAATAGSLTVALPRSSGTKLGRVRVYLSTSCDTAPPRAQCSDSQETAQVFGVDVPDGGLRPGGTVAIDASTLGLRRAMD